MTRTRRSVLLFGGLFVLAITVLGFILISLSDAFVSKHGDAMDWRSRWLVSRSIKWAQKQGKFQPKEMCFFLTSTL